MVVFLELVPDDRVLCYARARVGFIAAEKSSVCVQNKHKPKPSVDVETEIQRDLPQVLVCKDLNYSRNN